MNEIKVSSYNNINCKNTYNKLTQNWLILSSAHIIFKSDMLILSAHYQKGSTLVICKYYKKKKKLVMLKCYKHTL